MTVTNPYLPPTVSATNLSRQTDRRHRWFGMLAMLCGIGMAASGINRFIRYGGFALLRIMSPAERENAALWAATHLTAVVAAFVVSAGLFRKNWRLIWSGILIILAVCLFAWLWPMDFLWFGL